MSSAHDEHESAIKTPKQLIAAVAAGFLVPIVCIVLLVEYVTNGQKTGAGSDSQTPEMIAARIRPVADNGFTFRDASAPKQLQSGEEVFKSTCSACHAAGVAGAPKVGDEAAWKARIAEGYDTLVAHAINGLRAMPPKGGNPDLDDVEIQRTVVYMANQSGAKFKEPEVKAPAAAPAGDGAAAPTTAPAPAAAPAK
jgi:cytochrome c5